MYTRKIIVSTENKFELLETKMFRLEKKRETVMLSSIKKERKNPLVSDSGSGDRC